MTCVVILLVIVAVFALSPFIDRIFESDEKRTKRLISDRKYRASKRHIVKRIEEILSMDTGSFRNRKRSLGVLEVSEEGYRFEEGRYVLRVTYEGDVVFESHAQLDNSTVEDDGKEFTVLGGLQEVDIYRPGSWEDIFDQLSSEASGITRRREAEKADKRKQDLERKKKDFGL